MKISLQKLSTKNLATLAQRVINSSKSGNYTIIENHPLLTALETSYTNYDAVYTKLTYSGKGMDVATADKARDVAFGNMKAFLSGYRKLSTAPNHEASIALYDVFRTFGLGIDRMSYSTETAQMKKLIEALEAPKNTEYLTALSLTDAFADLKTKQVDFETLFAEQAEANAELRQMDSATSLRKNLQTQLKTYLDLVTAMKSVDGWQNLYADLNELVKAAKNSVTSSATNTATTQGDA